MADGLTLDTVLPPEDAAVVDALGPVEALVAVTALNQARTAPAGRRRRGRRAGPGPRGTEGGGPLRRRRVAGRHVRGRRGTHARGARRARRERPDHRTARARPGRGRGAGGGAPRRRARRGRRRRRTRQHRPRVGRARCSARSLQGEADYVSPVYARALTEGTLTTNLLAPLVRSLFGKRLQEVLGGCAGVSAAPARAPAPGGGMGRRADRPGRGDAAPRRGPGRAATRSSRSIWDGSSSIPGPRPPISRTPSSTRWGPLFRLMERHAAEWQDVRGSVPVPRRGRARPRDADRRRRPARPDGPRVPPRAEGPAPAVGADPGGRDARSALPAGAPRSRRVPLPAVLCGPAWSRTSRWPTTSGGSRGTISCGR